MLYCANVMLHMEYAISIPLLLISYLKFRWVDASVLWVTSGNNVTACTYRVGKKNKKAISVALKACTFSACIIHYCMVYFFCSQKLDVKAPKRYVKILFEKNHY